MVFVQIFYTTFQANSPASSALFIEGFVADQTIVVYLHIRAKGEYSDGALSPLKMQFIENDIFR